MFAVTLEFSDFAIIALLIIVFASSTSVYSSRQKDSGRMMRIEAKLDLLLHQMGIKYDPTANVDAAVRDALRDGNKIEAIKRYREVTGAGLAEAKEAIEDLQARGL